MAKGQHYDGHSEARADVLGWHDGFGGTHSTKALLQLSAFATSWVRGPVSATSTEPEVK